MWCAALKRCAPIACAQCQPGVVVQATAGKEQWRGARRNRQAEQPRLSPPLSPHTLAPIPPTPGPIPAPTPAHTHRDGFLHIPLPVCPLPEREGARHAHLRMGFVRLFRLYYFVWGGEKGQAAAHPAMHHNKAPHGATCHAGRRSNTAMSARLEAMDNTVCAAHHITSHWRTAQHQQHSSTAQQQQHSSTAQQHNSSTAAAQQHSTAAQQHSTAAQHSSTTAAQQQHNSTAAAQHNSSTAPNGSAPNGSLPPTNTQPTLTSDPFLKAAMALAARSSSQMLSWILGHVCAECSVSFCVCVVKCVCVCFYVCSVFVCV